MEQNKIIKLDIGCGMNSQEGYTRIDIDPLVKPDILAHEDPLRLFDDSEIYKKPNPFGLDCIASNSVDEIYCRHMLEHVKDLKTFFEECYRVLKPSGKLRIIVPHYMHETAYTDPDHKNIFTPTFFNYLSRDLVGSDGRPVRMGNFDFVISNALLIVDPKAKKRYKTNKELEFAGTYLWNTIKEIDITLIPVTPIRDIEIEGKPPTAVKRDWK